MEKTYKLTAIAVLLILGACRKSEDFKVPNKTAVVETVAAVNPDYIPKVCIDMRLPGKQNNGAVTNGVELTDNRWPNGKVLRVKFLNGTPFLKAKVMQFAKAWEPYANLTFVQVYGSVSDIRVGFKINGNTGSWSYLGTDALSIPANQQTINFGWFDDKTDDAEFSRTGTHEFGHAIGLVHEQSSPVEAIKWNKAAVYKYYEGPPNHWTKEQVDNNVLFRYSKQITQYTTFDPLSIMEYPIDPSFTTDGKGIGLNYYLSATDKTFIGNIYPKRVTDIDGNIYTTVQLGKQTWLAQNLRVTHYANGDPILNVTDKAQWAALKSSAYCSYNNNPTYTRTYGLLYNQYAINDARSICPPGWHIPTLAEWKVLQALMTSEGATGGDLKEVGTAHWLSPNTGATNLGGFNALGSGWRDHLGNFMQFQALAWWGYTGAKSTDTHLPSVNATSKTFGVIPSTSQGNLLGLSLRLVKDTDVQ